ncbi:hypothetical protein UT300017_17460 [Clostridium sp. CTA-17]
MIRHPLMDVLYFCCKSDYENIKLTILLEDIYLNNVNFCILKSFDIINNREVL